MFRRYLRPNIYRADASTAISGPSECSARTNSRPAIRRTRRSIECLVSRSCRGASRHIRRHWTQQLINRPFHCAVHFRNHRWDIALIYFSYFRNSVGPHGRARSEICHLRGYCDFNLDATLVVDFLELLQSSAKHVLDVGATVVTLDMGKVSAGAEALDY